MCRALPHVACAGYSSPASSAARAPSHELNRGCLRASGQRYTETLLFPCRTCLFYTCAASLFLFLAQALQAGAKFIEVIRLPLSTKSIGINAPVGSSTRCVRRVSLSYLTQIVRSDTSIVEAACINLARRRRVTCIPYIVSNMRYTRKRQHTPSWKLAHNTTPCDNLLEPLKSRPPSYQRHKVLPSTPPISHPFGTDVFIAHIITFAQQRHCPRSGCYADQSHH